MRAVIALAALGALTACGSQEAKKPQGAAFEKVLPGSASDAMLPYDTASSAPPLAPETYEPEEDATPRSRGTTPDAVMEDIAPQAEPT